VLPTRAEGKASKPPSEKDGKIDVARFLPMVLRHKPLRPDPERMLRIVNAGFS